jgi:hypothetical protein
MKTSGNWTIEGFFADRPESFRLFEIVRTYIESLGPVTVEAMKSQISFGSKTKFAWVWLPQIWIKKRSEKGITLTFDVGRHIVDARIEEAVEPRPGRWTHHVIIEREADLDESVRGWLREAYESGQRGAKKSRRGRKRT